MQDASNSIDTSLAGLDTAEWKSGLIAQAEANGLYEPLGKRHFATFIDEKNTLLVTFETVQGIRTLSETAQPFGFDMVKAQGWSHLCVISDGDTWFRESRVYGFFDHLIDDGFFEEFDQVVFYGAGPCGYAAAAYSVAAPGATVVAVQPQATLDARLTEWDDRFVHMRRTSFIDRYGYAPDMLDAADRGFVIYDPRQNLDAMHSALFARSNVSRLRMPGMGEALQTRLVEMNILYRILSLAGVGKLTDLAFHQMYRARRENVSYLRGLRARLDGEERPYLNMLTCRNVTERMHAPQFRRRLVALEKQAEAGDFRPPPAIL
ncbi:MAG: hypothetical protein ACI8R4_000574 [Paracoccaceae bacterium]|jgi:hypothetical protein